MGGTTDELWSEIEHIYPGDVEQRAPRRARANDR
jgi:hypothetical protein